MDFLLFAVIGSCVGLVSGLFGLGGGILMVPALSVAFQHLGFPPEYIMQMAAATSLGIMLFTSQTSMLIHRKHGTVIWPVYKKIIIGISLGVIVGALGAHFLHATVLKLLFAFFLAFVSFRMLFLKELHAITPQLNPWFGQSVGFLIGTKSGALGVGGGALVVSFLVHSNTPMPQAIAVSASVSASVAVIGTIMYMIIGYGTSGLPAHSMGYVYWPAVVAAVIPGMLLAPIGVHLAHVLPILLVKRIFAGVLMSIAVYMVWALI